MVAWSGRTVVDIPIAEAIAGYKAVDLDGPLVHTARGLGIYLGEFAA
jgi:6-phosphofructokinase 1